MTHEELNGIRRDWQSMTAVEIARKYSITRQRVYQVLKKAPGEEVNRKRSKALHPPYSDTPVRFTWKSNAHLNDEALQQAILASAESDSATARTYGCSEYAVYQIRTMRGTPRKTGAPRKKRTAEELEARRLGRLERIRAARKADPDRFDAYSRESRQRLSPEIRKARAHEAYERRKDSHLAYSHAYYQRNREAMLGRNRAWKSANPDRVKAHRQLTEQRKRERNLTTSPPGVG